MSSTTTPTAGGPIAQELDRDADTPLWLQLRLMILRQIQDGVYQPLDQLPSESELCQRYGISRTVVRATLANLVADGHIYKIKGKGAFVSRRKVDEEFAGTTMGYWEEMLLKGHDVRTRVLQQERTTPSRSATTALHLEPDDEVVFVRRIYLVDGTPTILVSTSLPASLVPDLERATMENRSLYETIRRRYGLNPARAERWIEAALAKGDDARLLEIEDGSPVLNIESIAYLESGEPVEYYQALNRTDQSRLYVVAR